MTSKPFEEQMENIQLKKKETPLVVGKVNNLYFVASAATAVLTFPYPSGEPLSNRLCPVKSR